MGVVAPGNKQIGSWAFNLVSGSKGTVKIGSSTGFGLVQTSVIGTPIIPYNVNLGSCSINLLGSCKSAFKISQVLGLAVVKYSLPTRLYFNAVVGLAAVVDSTITGSISPLKTIGVGGLNINALSSSKTVASVGAVLGLALVQFSSPRKESTYHSINYGLNNTVKV